MRGTETHSAPVAYATTAAGLTDADGVKTVAAAPIAATTYAGAALNGAVQAAGFEFPRYVTVTSTANAATYNTTDPIVVTGTRSGITFTAALQLTNAGGGETITSTIPFENVTSIAVPAQLQAAGGLAFGVVDMGCPLAAPAGVAGDPIPFRSVKVNGAGNLVVGWADGSTTTIPCLAGDREPVLAHRIYGTSTATPIVAYL